MKRAIRTAACLVAATATAMLTATPAYSVTAPKPQIPEGMTASYLVADADSGKISAEADGHDQYRSASVVKLLLALDYLETLGPDKKIPEEDEALLEPMLRSSNDDAASTFWVRGGQADIIKRMVDKIGLKDTAPPPADNAGVWGYTAISATDVAKIYRYILDEADSRASHFLLKNLDKHTECAADGFDQSFGVPSAVEDPGAVKQGWSGFGDGPEPGKECQDSDNPAMTANVLNSPEVAHARTMASLDTPRPLAADDGVDLTRRAMHTTGIVDDREKIIVVLTLEPEDTSWESSDARITELTEKLDRATD